MSRPDSIPTALFRYKTIALIVAFALVAAISALGWVPSGPRETVSVSGATPTNTATPTWTPTWTPTFTPTPPVVCDLVENFDSGGQLPPGWAQRNNSEPMGPGTWSVTSGYVTVGPDSTGFDGTISNWLFTPTMLLSNGGQVSFVLYGGSFSRVQLRMSTNGASTNVGTTATDVGDFTTVLLDIDPTYGYHEYGRYTATIEGLSAPVEGRFAFRYFVEDGHPWGNNTNSLIIDSFTHHCAAPGYGIPVSLPSLSAVQHVTVPMDVGGLTGRGVTSYQFNIAYNAQSVWCSGVNTAGTLSSGMTITESHTQGQFGVGHVTVTATGAAPLSGHGTLINLYFGSWDNSTPRSSALQFQDYVDPGNVVHPAFQFNSGDPTAITTDGGIALYGQQNTPTATVTPTGTPCGVAGALDPYFGYHGIMSTVIDNGSTADRANAVAVQSDGKIVIAGVTSHLYYGTSHFVLARYDRYGALDQSFGIGAVITDFSQGYDVANALAVQPDGKIVAAGVVGRGSDGDFAIARYNTNGWRDLSFGVSGKVITQVDTVNDVGNAVAIQPDGKIIVAGIAQGNKDNFGLVRYNTNGSLDTSFGTGGKVITSVGFSSDRAFAMAIQPDGKIVAAGSSVGTPAHGRDFALVRYNIDGSLDTSFNGDGKVVSQYGAFNDEIHSLAIQPGGKIVAAGYSECITCTLGSRFALVRYNTDGSLDTSFNGSGRVFTTFGASIPIDRAYGVTLQPDGKILATGPAYNGSNYDFGLARYNLDGSLDTSFDGDGKVLTPYSNYQTGTDVANAVALEPDGQIVVAGYSDYGITLAKYFGESLCPFGTPTRTPTITPTSTRTPTPTASPTCLPGNLIVDGGFENGGIPSTVWTHPQSSTNFGTPLCDATTCGTGGGASPPRTGAVWAWFGGSTVPETARLGQDVVIPVGTASLHFWMRIGTTMSPYTDVLNVKVDGNIVRNYVEPQTPEFVYTERVIDLTAFADSASHNITFEYIGTTTGVASYVIDDVSLVSSAIACASPTSTGTNTPVISPTMTSTITPTNTATVTATATCTPLAFTNPTVIPINDGGMSSSSIPVSNFLGTVTKVTVDLHGVSHSFPDDIDIMLVGPGGQNTLLMSDAGGDSDATGLSFTFDDAVALALPDDTRLSGGTFGPTNYDTTTDVFPAPAPQPGGPVAMGVFIGTNPNGVWTLYVRDDTNLDSGGISDGWTLHITTTGGSICATATATATATSFQPTPAVGFNSSTYAEDESQIAAITIRKVVGVEPEYVSFSTFDGTATGGPACTEGIDYINVSQQVFLPRFETEKTLYVQTCGDSLGEGDETINLRLSNPILGTLGLSSAVLTIRDAASAYRNNENVSITGGAASLPYPSSITVAGAPNAIGSMRVTLFDLSSRFPDDADFLLIGPNGAKYILLAGAGGLAQSGPATLNFSDTAGAVVPDNGPLFTGNFEPTSWGTVGDFPAPAPPGPYNLPGSTIGGTGTQTLMGNFGGSDANGVWSLYVRDRSPATDRVGNLAGGWGLQFIRPTAAGASISGRVTTAIGQGIRNAKVTITGNSLADPLVTTTGSFGYFSFDGLQTGETYVVTVNSRRYSFSTPSRVISLVDNVTDADFVADPLE